MRLFFGIEVPADVRDKLSDFQDRLRRRVPEHVSWVAPEQFHITLKFLGEYDEARLRKIALLLSHSLFPPPMQLAVASLTSLPRGGRARIIAAEVWESTGDLLWVRNTLEHAAVEAGFEPDQERLEPHITLGHVRPPQRIRASELLEYGAGDWTSVAFNVNRIELFESTLSRLAATYHRIGILTLAGTSTPARSSLDLYDV